MSHRPRRIPSYTLHKSTGQARVRIDGRDHYLGDFDSPESRSRYDRLIAEWLASGRAGHARPAPNGTTGHAPADVTIDEVLAAYWSHAEGHYRRPDGSPSPELDNIRDALKPLRRLYGPTEARRFGPRALRAVRDEMIRSGLARTTTNARINKVRRVFRWAASVEMLPVEVHQRLVTVEGLAVGRSAAREPEPVRPVPIADVEATLPHLPGPVAAMVRVQILSGCRAGEVMAMRRCDLTPDGDVWLYRPGSHKNAWRGRDRVIVLGPKAVEAIRPMLKPDATAFLFSPRDAVAEMHAARAAARKSVPTPSERRRRARSTPGAGRAERYDRRSYRQAIVRACDAAGVPRWSPLQLRHAAATAVRSQFGLEASQDVLGHAKPDVTIRYAERSLDRAREVMRQIG